MHAHPPVNATPAGGVKCMYFPTRPDVHASEKGERQGKTFYITYSFFPC